MDNQSRIREELIKAEERCDFYWRRHCVVYFISEQLMYYDLFIHWSGRRRFFLKDLLKVQLREFNHAKASGKQRS